MHVSMHEHNLREANYKLFVPRPLSEFRKKRFSYRGAILWNNMPVQISRGGAAVALMLDLQFVVSNLQ